MNITGVSHIQILTKQKECKSEVTGIELHFAISLYYASYVGVREGSREISKRKIYTLINGPTSVKGLVNSEKGFVFHFRFSELNCTQINQ